MTVITADRRFQLDNDLGVVTLTSNSDGARLSMTMNSKLVLREEIPAMRNQNEADALTDALVNLAGVLAKTTPQAL